MAEILQEFLVKLGYSIDQGQHNRFLEGIKTTHAQMGLLEKTLTKSVSSFYELATAAGGTAIALGTALSKLALGMATMSFQSQRVGASAGAVHALGYAFTQAGGSVEDANSTLEAYAATLRTVPGLEAQLKGIYGVTATDRAEQLVQIGTRMRRDVEAAGPAGSIRRDQEIATQLAKVQDILHISQQQALLMMRPQIGPGYQEAIDRQNRVGVDWAKAAAEGEAYRQQVNRIWDTFNNLKTKIAEDFTPGMTTSLRGFGNFLEGHEKQIGSYLHNMALNFDSVKSSIDKWWSGLSEEAQGNITTGAVVGGGAAAIAGGTAAVGGLLSLARVPGAAQIARLGGLSLAILALKNDYETWKRTEGKEGLIDWGKWEPSINLATNAIKSFNDNLIFPLADKLGVDRTFVPAFEGLVAFLVGSQFLGVLKTSGLWAFFTFLRSPLSWLTLLGGDTAKLSPEDQKLLDERNAKELEEYKRAHPDFVEPGPREPAPSGGMLNNLFRRWFGGGGGSSQAGNYTPTADTAMPEERRRFLDALSIGESRGSYDIKNPTSTAHGRYQFLDSTDAEVSARTGLVGSDPVSQDRKGWYYAELIYRKVTGRDLGADLKEGGHEAQIAAGLRGVWPSLPGGSQQNTTMEQWLARMKGQMTGTQIGRAMTVPSAGSGSLGADTGRAPFTAPPPTPSAVPSGSGSIAFNSAPTITINGVSDPQLAANYVARASERQNADVLRRLSSVYA